MGNEKLEESNNVRKQENVNGKRWFRRNMELNLIRGFMLSKEQEDLSKSFHKHLVGIWWCLLETVCLFDIQQVKLTLCNRTSRHFLKHIKRMK